MARGRKTGGRQKGARNRATAEARAAAEAKGILPLDYMLSVMRDANTDAKRRDAMAMAAAPYLHPKMSAVEPKPEKRAGAEEHGIRVVFVRPRPPDEDGFSPEELAAAPPLPTRPAVPGPGPKPQSGAANVRFEPSRFEPSAPHQSAFRNPRKHW